MISKLAVILIVCTTVVLRGTINGFQEFLKTGHPNFGPYFPIETSGFKVGESRFQGTWTLLLLTWNYVETVSFLYLGGLISVWQWHAEVPQCMVGLDLLYGTWVD